MVQYIDRRLDRTGDCPLPILPVILDDVRVLREAFDQFVDRLVNRKSFILPQVPFVETNFIEKVFNGGGVIMEELAEEIVRLPIEQNAPKVEDNGWIGLFYYSLRHDVLSFAPAWW